MPAGTPPRGGQALERRSGRGARPARDARALRASGARRGGRLPREIREAVPRRLEVRSAGERAQHQDQLTAGRAAAREHDETQSDRHPGRRPALRRDRRLRASVHEDARTSTASRARARCSRNAFHTTPLCSPNRASIVTGQYASRHGIIDNVGRDAISHRLANYHLALQALGYETAHIGKWHMGNDARPRPATTTGSASAARASSTDPVLWEHGGERPVAGYVTDLLSARRRVRAPHAQAALRALLAHKAVHPDLHQKPDGSDRRQHHRRLHASRAPPRPVHGLVYPLRPSVRPLEEVVRRSRRAGDVRAARRPAVVRLLDAIDVGTQEEIRERAAMMASVDEGVGPCSMRWSAGGARRHLHRLPRRQWLLLRRARPRGGAPFRLRGGDPHAVLRALSATVRPGTTVAPMVLAIDIAPTMIDLAGGAPGLTCRAAPSCR